MRPARFRRAGVLPRYVAGAITVTDPGDSCRHRPVTLIGPRGTASVRRYPLQPAATRVPDLGHDERAAILAWGSFTVAFDTVRALTTGSRPATGRRVAGSVWADITSTTT